MKRELYIYKLHKIYTKELLGLINQNVAGRIRKSRIKERCYTIYWHRTTIEFVHMLIEHRYPLSTTMNDFEVLEIYGMKPTEEDQKMYRDFMLSKFGEDYKLDLEDYLYKKQKADMENM